MINRRVSSILQILLNPGGSSTGKVRTPYGGLRKATELPVVAHGDNVWRLATNSFTPLIHSKESFLSERHVQYVSADVIR